MQIIAYSSAIFLNDFSFSIILPRNLPLKILVGSLSLSSSSSDSLSSQPWCRRRRARLDLAFCEGAKDFLPFETSFPLLFVSSPSYNLLDGL